MNIIPATLIKSRKWINSYTLKHSVEGASSYKPNGDVILALLLLGHKAKKRFGNMIMKNPCFLLKCQ